MNRNNDTSQQSGDQSMFSTDWKRGKETTEANLSAKLQSVNDASFIGQNALINKKIDVWRPNQTFVVARTYHRSPKPPISGDTSTEM